MNETEMILSLVGAVFVMLTMGVFLVWFCGELPRQRYREFLSELTKYGSYTSGSAPD